MTTLASPPSLVELPSFGEPLDAASIMESLDAGFGESYETPAIIENFKPTSFGEPLDAVTIIENINATVAAKYTFEEPTPVLPNLSTLCSACKAIFDSHSLLTSPRSPALDGRLPGELVHQSLDSVAEAAKQGCHLCVTIYMHLDPAALRAFRRYINASLGRNSPDKDFARLNRGFTSIEPIARDQARLTFRWVANPEISSPSNVAKAELAQSSYFANYHNRNDSQATMSSDGSWNMGRMDSELVVELILMKPMYAVEPGVRTVSLTSTSTASDDCFEIAKQWLDDCSFNHMKCSANEASGAIQKPTYLLDVTIKGPNRAPGVKLVDGQFLDPFTEYVTLSHCWGISRDPLMKRVRLHKKTLAALRQGVANSSLPKTFADAAIATLKLGYKYLWIDALCIMHDNEKAVLEEVANMHRIYGEATVNLAATGASDDFAGLFFSRNAIALQPVTVDVAEGFGISGGPYKILRSTIWEDFVDASPLAQRAWIFQERALSKRTLHFTRNEVLWECQQMCCSEVFPKGLPVTLKDQDRRQAGLGPGTPVSDRSFNLSTPKVSFSKRIHHQRTANWHTLVELYTEGRMTYTSDKLLGIAGVARQYSSRNRLQPSDYAVGLWRPSLPHSLLWRVHEAVGKRPPKYRAPTWTWASIDGRVNLPVPSQASKQTCLEIITIDLQHRNNDPLSLCESGRITVRGFMGKGSLRRTRDYWGHCAFSLLPTDRRIGEVRFENAWFDERLPKLCDESAGIMVETLEVYLLPVIDVMDRVEGLILCATMKKGEFKRLGLFEIGNTGAVNGPSGGQGGPGGSAYIYSEGRRPQQDNWDNFKRLMKGDPDMLNYEERLDHTNAYWFASDYTYTVTLL